MHEPGNALFQRVLVVEDNEAIRSLLSRLLERRGYAVASLASGEAAVDASAEGFDVVLLDVGLPDLNGLEVCRRIRARASTANLPIVIMTGRAEPGDIRDGLAAGADDFVTKPFDTDDLILRLNRVSRASRRPQAS
jgi:DNA-binding response OmpR family regulator